MAGVRQASLSKMTKAVKRMGQRGSVNNEENIC